jgi:hypothetical protein
LVPLIDHDISPELSKRLKELLDKFPDRFELYYYQAKDIDILNFFAIDHEIPTACVVEMIISSKTVHGEITPLSIAGTAMFIRGKC